MAAHATPVFIGVAALVATTILFVYGSAAGSTAANIGAGTLSPQSRASLKPSHTSSRLFSPQTRKFRPFTRNAVQTETEAPVKTEIDTENAAMLLEDMHLGRKFEDATAQWYQRGKVFGFVHLGNGQEAVSSGSIKQLRNDDYICSTYRDHVHALSKGCDPKKVMAELFAKKTGICNGQGGSMHMFSKENNMLGGYAFIGEGIPVALGAAFQTAYRRNVLKDPTADQVTLAFFGDGTTNVGQFAECLNMASLYKLPIIFIVENNLWAIGMYHYRATAPSLGDQLPHIYKKGPAFGMPGKVVDGMDVLSVQETVAEAIERARNGEGPTLIEAETYRYRGHSLADPDVLRTAEEKERFAKQDPIEKFRKYCLETGLLTESQIEDIEKRVDAKVQEAIEFADSSPKPDKSQLLNNVFADPKGFGVDENGKYRYENPSFIAKSAAAGL